MCSLLVPLLPRLNFFFFLLRPLTVLMKQTRQAVRANKQFILLRCLWTSLLWLNLWQLLLYLWSHFVVLLKSDLDVQQTHLWLLRYLAVYTFLPNYNSIFFQQKFEAKDGDLHLNLADKFRTKSSNKDIESVKCYCTGQENAPFCKKA